MRNWLDSHPLVNGSHRDGCLGQVVSQVVREGDSAPLLHSGEILPANAASSSGTPSEEGH